MQKVVLVVLLFFISLLLLTLFGVTSDDIVRLKSTQAPKVVVLDDNISQGKVRTPLRRNRMLVLLTESRSGSTWLMKMLSFPKRTVSFFEPLNTHYYLTHAANHSPKDHINQSDLRKWHQVILSRICACNLAGNHDNYSLYSIVPVLPVSRFYRERSGRYGAAYDTCRRRRTVKVVKTIRLYNISDLYDVYQGSCNKMQVIHLIRDPRAVLYSRMLTFLELYDGNHIMGPRVDTSSGLAAFNESYVRKAAHDLCSHGVYNYKQAIQFPWLQNIYQLVRYEDLVDNTISTIKMLYSFSSLDYDQDVDKFVYNTTHTTAKSNYGFHRNKNDVSEKWKRDDEFAIHIATINSECMEFFSVFGYTIL